MRNTIFDIELDVKPLSVNQAWQGQRFKTDKYNSYQKEVILKLKPSKSKIGMHDKLRVEFTFGFSNNLSDLDNPVKPIMDILCKKYGFDDRQVYELEISKKIVDKGSEYIKARIINLLPF